MRGSNTNEFLLVGSPTLKSQVFYHLSITKCVTKGRRGCIEVEPVEHHRSVMDEMRHLVDVAFVNKLNRRNKSTWMV